MKSVPDLQRRAARDARSAAHKRLFHTNGLLRHMAAFPSFNSQQVSSNEGSVLGRLLSVKISGVR